MWRDRRHHGVLLALLVTSIAAYAPQITSDVHGLCLRAIRKYQRTAKTIKIAAEIINLNSISTPEASSGRYA
jgi:hypothetical protein